MVIEIQKTLFGVKNTDNSIKLNRFVEFLFKYSWFSIFCQVCMFFNDGGSKLVLESTSSGVSGIYSVLNSHIIPPANISSQSNSGKYKTSSFCKG